MHATTTTQEAARGLIAPGIRTALAAALGVPEDGNLVEGARRVKLARDVAVTRAATAERRADSAVELVLALHLDGRLGALTGAESEMLRLVLDLEPGDEGNRRDVDDRLRTLLAPRTARFTPPRRTTNVDRPTISLGELAEAVTSGARLYRRDWRDTVLREHGGQPLTPAVVRAVAVGFAGFDLFSSAVRYHLLRRIETWELEGVAWLDSNAHMHAAHGHRTLTPESFDALLVGFCNVVCAPLDLALYARDLEVVRRG